MRTHDWGRRLAAVAACGLGTMLALAAEEKLPDSKLLMRALVDELDRAMQLQLEDLEKPYFIQFDVDDNLTYQLSADYGALTSSTRQRTRTFRCRVRVGSPELDNTNFADRSFFFFFGGGGTASQAALPLDDDYLALRQVMWRTADQEYKNAVETLTKKKAYMRDKNIVDRPPDFSEGPIIEHVEPTAVLHFDRALWETRLPQLSAHFRQYEQIQEARVQLYAGAGNAYVVNSEGTRLRSADQGALLLVTARVQADDGMYVSGSRSYAGETTADFPPLADIRRDLDQLVAELLASREAEPVEYYNGPVLFDGLAAAQMFQALLASGVVGRPDLVGEQRRSLLDAGGLESRLGTRILPRSFAVWDDPTVSRYADQPLLGSYSYDDEGVPARRVDIVVDGVLEDMCLSRAPTRRLSGSSGHARRPPGGAVPEAAIGCLFIHDEEGLPLERLKAELIAEARDAGLEYGIRVTSLRAAGITATRSDLLSMLTRVQRGGSLLGDPVVAYKVYVEDGREEPLRGCEFGPVQVTMLRRITAAGNAPTVYNYVGLGPGGAAPPATIVAPPVLFEELELVKVREEYEKPPILAAPAGR